MFLKKYTVCRFHLISWKKAPQHLWVWEPQAGSLINRQGLLHSKGILQLLLHKISWCIHTVWSTSLKALGLGEKLKPCN